MTTNRGVFIPSTPEVNVVEPAVPPLGTWRNGARGPVSPAYGDTPPAIKKRRSRTAVTEKRWTLEDLNRYMSGRGMR